jgi:hypothetical protein
MHFRVSLVGCRDDTPVLGKPWQTPMKSYKELVDVHNEQNKTC